MLNTVLMSELSKPTKREISYRSPRKNRDKPALTQISYEDEMRFRFADGKEYKYSGLEKDITDLFSRNIPMSLGEISRKLKDSIYTEISHALNNMVKRGLIIRSGYHPKHYYFLA